MSEREKAKGFELPSALTPVKRIYSDLAGVDFSRLPSSVALNRSPDALNVYKDYDSTLGQAIQTRPGFSVIGNAEGKIYGIHSLGSYTLIHYGNKIALANGFPNEIIFFSEFNFTMNKAVSSSFLFEGKLYILDGINYLVFNGITLANVIDNAYIPTTRISADPDGGNGRFYQNVNYLSHYRKNSFVSDGVSTEYYLDAIDVDDYTPEVTVNGVNITEGFSLDYINGKVIFETAPQAPFSIGTDNVVITYKKTINSYPQNITRCTLSAIFDNRVFVSGNANKKGIVFHSELEDPTYFADESWYNDGEDDIAVKALICGANLLCVVKADGGTTPKIYYHIPSLDESYGKVYPSYSTGIVLGAKAAGINFKDDIVFISSHGLESIAVSSNNAKLNHRSSNVDTRLTNENNLEDMCLEVFKGYLMCLVNGKIYLADSRQIYSGIESREYEWYFWNNIGVYDNGNFKAGYIIKNYENRLIFGCENGAICKFEGTNDNGILIDSYWCSKEDIFSSPAHLKSTKKRGGVAIVKRIPNSVVKVAIGTDKKSFEKIKEFRTSGFNFNNVNFTEFVFSTGNRGYVVFNMKRRNIWSYMLKFYSDEIDKPFGLYEASVEVSEKRYLRK